MKATAIDMLKQSIAMWTAFLAEITDQGDKTNLLVDIATVWFMGQMLLFVGLVSASKHSFPLVGALLCFGIVGLIALYTIVCWEASKYVWKNGKKGYKHTRREV
jgi:hypothetical protein